jgi:hypothetical protein
MVRESSHPVTLLGQESASSMNRSTRKSQTVVAMINRRMRELPRPGSSLVRGVRKARSGASFLLMESVNVLPLHIATCNAGHNLRAETGTRLARHPSSTCKAEPVLQGA